MEGRAIGTEQLCCVHAQTGSPDPDANMRDVSATRYNNTLYICGIILCKHNVRNIGKVLLRY